MLYVRVLTVLSIWMGRISYACYISEESKNVVNVCRDEIPKTTSGDRDNDDCFYWCNGTSSLSYRVTDAELGLMEVSIIPSPLDCDHDKMEFYLEVVEGVSCLEIQKKSQFVSHSCQDTLVKNVKSPNCSKNIVLKFDYIFSGCYRVVIKPKSGYSSLRECSTNHFDVVTNYTKALLQVPTVHVSGAEARLSLTAGWDIKSPFWIETILAKLAYLVLNKHNEEEETDLVGHSCILNVNSHIIDGTSQDNCSCEWLKSSLNITLQCTFSNVSDAKYRIILEGDDTRCAGETLWWNHNCNWHYDYEFVSPNITGEVTVKPDGMDILGYCALYAVLIFLALLATAAVYIFHFRFYRRRKHCPRYEVVKMHVGLDVQDLLSQKVKLLLLYPRDCPPFMESMEAFRQLLRSIDNFEVIDPHDPDLYEDVATCLDTWGSEYVMDNTTKVILVASWCSLKFEDAFVKSYRLAYSDRLSSDHVFTNLLHRLFSPKNDSLYKKIYVVRMDCEETEKLQFQQLVQCRNFTIPQCIDQLVQMLLSLPVEKPLKVQDPTDTMTVLENSIKRYSLYLSENPDYLDKLLVREE